MKQKKNTLQLVLALSGVTFWGTVAWLYIASPLFILDLLPSQLPLSIFVFLLFLIGLLLLTGVATSLIRMRFPRYSYTVILLSALMIVSYNLSPLAPSWECFGKRLYVTIVKADLNCTTKCTNNKKAPCSGWSDCWDKYISCSGTDPKKCKGCCFDCEIVCEDDDDDDTPTYQRPTVSGSVTCSQEGNNGWCVGTSMLNMTASDPQDFAVTISGTIDGEEFTCATGNSCSMELPEGSGAISFSAIAATSKLTSTRGSAAWKRDVTPPELDGVYPAADGLNGWYITSPLTAFAVGSDTISGLANAQVSVNGGDWQSSALLASEGVYTLDFMSVDSAGNVSTSSSTISIDTTPPSLSFVFNGTAGDNDWYVSNVEVSTDAADATAGLGYVEFSADGGSWVSTQTLSDGAHSLDGRTSDQAGNTTTVSETLNIDTLAPSSSFSSHLQNQVISGAVQLCGTSSDITSGLRSVEVSLDGGSSWMTTTLSGDTWTYAWDATTLHNGIYTAQLRGVDNAGNYESPESLTLLVDNFPPQVKITESWWIWESGAYQVSPSYFDVDEVSVKISDPKDRWKPVRLSYNPKKKTGDVIWDRRFPGDVIAPSGKYRVSIVACDVHGNCANDEGIIEIPFIAAVPPTSTTTLEMVPTSTPIAALPPTSIAVQPASSRPQSTNTAQPLIPVPKDVEAYGEGRRGAPFPLWVILIFSLLCILFGTEALLDPRPEALRSLARTINQFVKE